ncbi:MAG: phosphoglycolate phosphatase [Campylobacterota bacterium]|nr:phosphoglycolate phosphatase [Campylobacterota bacterium]
MKLQDKELIIFDLDGTLIDSGADLALALNAMLRELKRQEFSEDEIHTWVGNGAQTLVKRALSGGILIDENIDDSLFKEALEIFLDSYKNNVCVKTTLYPHVRETLVSLHKNGYTMAIVTNKPFEFVAPILSTLKLDKYFSLILGGDSLKEKKPSALPLLHVCEKLNVSIEKGLMVGDSKNDILAAKAANMDSIGVTYGYNYGESIDLYKPNAIIDEFSKITEL